MRGGELVLERGAIFTNVLLADEINRTPPRVQAGLLEAMQERHVTLRGRTYFIDPPFFVMATQNPYEHEGVFPITESQLDRFLVKVDLEYGDEDAELRTLDLPHRGVIPDMLGDISPLLGERAFLVAQEVVDEVSVSEDGSRACACASSARRDPTRGRAGREPARVAASDDGGEGAGGRCRAGTPSRSRT